MTKVVIEALIFGAILATWMAGIHAILWFLTRRPKD